VSRLYRTGYNAPAVLVLVLVLVLVMLPPLSSLTPFLLFAQKRASVQVGLSAIKLLRCVFMFPAS
jgi:hypothetical protein